MFLTIIIVNKDSKYENVNITNKQRKFNIRLIKLCFLYPNKASKMDRTVIIFIVSFWLHIWWLRFIFHRIRYNDNDIINIYIKSINLILLFQIKIKNTYLHQNVLKSSCSSLNFFNL